MRHFLPGIIEEGKCSVSTDRRLFEQDLSWQEKMSTLMGFLSHKAISVTNKGQPNGYPLLICYCVTQEVYC
jgi:hypothetical protein